MYASIQQRCIKLIKSDSKTIYVTKKLEQLQLLSFFDLANDP